MPTSFRSLAELCEKLESTKKRLEMIELVADFLKSLEILEVEPAISMILGRPFPKWSQQTLDVSWSTVSNIVKRITVADQAFFSEAIDKTGDVGTAVKAMFENSKVKRQAVLFDKSLTIMELRRNFNDIASTIGSGSRERKERLVEALLSQASSVEAKYLVKIFIGEMRTGFHEGLMEQAVANAYMISLAGIQTANMMAGDIGEVAVIARTDGITGISKIGFRVFRPVNLMLAQMANGVDEALEEHQGKTAFEYKYDGARIQIHKFGDDVKVFSRRLTDVTESLPEIVVLIRENVHAQEAILEGEVIAVDASDRPIPFQHLMRRFRRIREVEDTAEEIPVRLFLFDILYLDGKSLIFGPYLERRQILAKTAEGMQLAKQLITDKREEAELFLKEAVAAGQEGLMAKRIDSPYTLGIRGKRWLKMKPVLDPLDLVITAAEYGYGRRHGWLSDYYLAARDIETGEFLEVGKTFKGLTDTEIVEMTRRLKEITVKDERWRVKVIPKIIVEVVYNEIQKSPKYKCGMALRFARITRIRDDKSVNEADTIQKVRGIYERQFLQKGKI